MLHKYNHTGDHDGEVPSLIVSAYSTNNQVRERISGFLNALTNSEEEIKKYLPFILKHIEIIQPKILILLGSTAMNALIGNDVVISKMRGQWIEKKFGNCKTSVLVTFHPAFLMRQPAQKKMAWIDLKMIRDKKTKLKI